MLTQSNGEHFVGLYGVSFGTYDCDDATTLLALFSTATLASDFEYAARLKVSQQNPRLMPCSCGVDDCDCWQGNEVQRYREKSPLAGYGSAVILPFLVDVDPEIPDYSRRGDV